MNAILACTIATERSRRGVRRALNELKNRLDLNYKAPETTPEWLAEIVRRYGWPTARLTAILLCSGPVGAYSIDVGTLISLTDSSIAGSEVDDRPRWNPMMGWIGREVHGLWTRMRSGARKRRFGSYLTNAIHAMDVQTRMSTSSVSGFFPVRLRRGEQIAVADMTRALWLRADLSGHESMLDAESFRELPRIRDWFEATGPNLSKFTMEAAAAASDAWHQKLTHGIVLPRGSARRGELVMVHPHSDVDDPDGFWTIQRLTTRHQYEDEGRALRHCVGGGGYWRQHKRGDLDIYSVRNEHGDPVLTVSVELDSDGDPDRVDQVKGENDQVPLDIIASKDTRTGDDWEMALSGAEALISHLEEEHGELGRGTDATQLLLFDPDGSLPKAIEEGDFEIDDNTGPYLADLVVSSDWDRDLVDAWVKALESGDSVFVSTVVAYEQMGLHLGELPTGMENLEDIVYRLPDGDRIDRSGDEDEVTPWLLRSERSIERKGATLSLRLACAIGFDATSRADTEAGWFSMMHSELRFEDGDRIFETDGWHDFGDRFDPERLIQRHSYTVPGKRRVSYVSWDPHALVRMFPFSPGNEPKTSWLPRSLYSVARTDWTSEVSKLVEQVNEWLMDDSLTETLGRLPFWQRDVVRHAFPRVEQRWVEEAVEVDDFEPATVAEGRLVPAEPDRAWAGSEPQGRLFVRKLDE